MLNIFKRKKSTINSITIPDFGWKKEKSTKTIIQWVNPEQTIFLSLNYFESEPDLPSLKKTALVRDFYRGQIIQHNGGLIEADLFELKNYQTIRTIFKIPQQPSGIVYLASLTIPFNNCSYVIKIQAPEIGETGIRESTISDQLLKDGTIKIGENGFENWFLDPYRKEFNKGTLMNKSEDSIYDPYFENHPLTQARKLISEIEKQIEFKPQLEKLKKF